MTTQYTRQGEFWTGVKDTFPLVLGATPFGIIFGAVAVTGGLSPAAAIGMSVLVFAGSSQFIGAGLFAQGVGIGVIIITTFVVNLRHALYGASLAPYVKRLSHRWLLPLGFWLTDETYAVVIRRYQQPDESPYKHWYHLGSSVFMYTNWQFWTIVGVVAGQQFTGLAKLGLDFALVVTFIGIVVPLLVTRPMLACTVVAAVVAVLANGLPNKLGLMVAALAGIAAGMLVETVLNRHAARNAKLFESRQSPSFPANR
ncbi:MAG: AzlC family ABC transporter permease [Chloroflexi bacterium]|nr:AzlC family ABC transporter permease [Chloroflexota bacterium]